MKIFLGTCDFMQSAPAELSLVPYLRTNVTLLGGVMSPITIFCSSRPMDS